MSARTILVVDDEEDILELVTYNLEREGNETLRASTGEEGLRAARSRRPDLIVLDLMLPSIDGLEVMKHLKQDSETRSIPVVMLTAKGEEADIVAGLELGADDYVVKPFSPRVLVARVRAVLRRQEGREPEEIIRIHGLEIHRGRRSVTANGLPIELTYTEFEILSFLASRPGWSFTRGQIVDAVRGDFYPVTDRSVDVQIVGLRKKLGDLESCIETVRGVGYRFKDAR